MPKPFADQDGAGLHLHFSVLDTDGQKIFDSGDALGTDLLRHAVAGVLTHATDMQLVMAPHYRSNRRLGENAYAPTLLSWGYDSRFLPIRNPAGAGKNRRIEHRIGGADANAYLLTALVLQAALDGMTDKAAPPAPVIGLPYAVGLQNVPTTMPEALWEFRNSTWIKRVIHPLFHEAYVNAK